MSSTTRRLTPWGSCVEDGCHKRIEDLWCDTFRARLALLIRTHAVHVEPPRDPLAGPVDGPCWVGLGAQSKKGYATARFGRTRRLSRVALASVGVTLGELHVDHLCRMALDYECTTDVAAS